ncbi:unnamed protein product [Lampetra planeri]
MRAASGLVGMRLVSLCGHAAQVATALWAAVASAWRCGDGALGRNCAEENLIACIPVPRITENQTPTNE